MRRGIQAHGICLLSNGDDELAAMQSYRDRFPMFGAALQNRQTLKDSGWSSRMWTFVPIELKVLNEPLLGPDNYVSVRIDSTDVGWSNNDE
jgi:hypothetical protein